MFKQTPKKRVLFVRTVIPVLLVLFGSLSLLALNFHSPKAAAATSSFLNFQARLETSAGAIAGDGNYNVEFKIYSGASCNPATGSGCTQQWSEDYLNSASHGIRVANGYLTANLGSITAFPSTINWDQQLWVSMNIGGTTTGSPSWDGEMFPLLQITAVPFAFQSKSAEQLTVLQGSNKGTLSFGTLTGNLDVSLPVPTGGGTTATVCYQTDTACGFLTTASGTTFVNLQSSTPGTAQIGNFNISASGGAGTGIAKLFQAATFDTASGTTILNIGDATSPNATTIAINQDTAVKAGKSISFASGAGNFDLHLSTGTFDTTTGNVNINGNTTVAAGKSITFATGAGNFDQHQSSGTFDTGTGAVTINGAAEFKTGATVDTGHTFTNASSTLNTSDLLGNFNFTGSGNTGSIGSAATTVDTHTAFTITQTTAGQTLTIPSPTGGAAGRTITIISDPASVQNFIINGATIAPGVTASFVYNGSAWVSASSNSGVNIVGSLATGTASPSANGASITGNTIYLQSASTGFAGLVDTLTQSFAGLKTFTSLLSGSAGITVSGAGVSLNDNSNFNTTINTGTSTGNVTIGGASQAGASAITLGQSILTNTITIGSAAGNAAIQTINIGISGTTGSTTNVVVGSTVAGTTTLQSQGGIKVSTLGGVTSNSVALCRDTSTNLLTACDGGSGGKPFVQNGNAFGATAVLGTTDANGLQIITGSSGPNIRAYFDTSNNLYLGNASTSGTATTPNNFNVKGTGSATAGTAGGNIGVTAGAGASTGTGSAGGVLNLAGGAAGTPSTTGNAAAGGAVNLTGGAGSGLGAASANGGGVTINGGVGFNAGTVGIVALQTGDGATTIGSGATSSSSTIAVGSATGVGTITLGRSTASNTINIGNAVTGSGNTQTIAIGTGATGTGIDAITIGSTSSSSTSIIQGGAYNLNVTNTGIGINTTAPSADLSFGNAADRTINIIASGAGNAGRNLTIAAAASGTGAVNGGNLNLTGGATGGSGFQGLVNLSASVFTTAVIAAYTSGPQTVAATAVDNNSAIQISSTVSSPITVTIPAPDNPSTGRVLYVTVAGSNQINLTPTGGTTFLMNAGSTATLIWNVALSAWTNAGVDGGSNSYIQNQVASTQSANFKIQGKTGNVAATIQGESGNSADILDLVSSAGGTPVVAVDHSGNLTFNQASTVKSNAGILTFQGFAGTNINTPTASAAATSDVNIATGNETGSFASGNIFMQTGTTTAGNTGTVTVTSGNATGGTAGTVRIDTGTGGSPVLQIGNTNAKVVTIGNTGNTSTGLNGNAVNITSAADTTIIAGASNAVNIGSTASVTTNSTTNIGNTNNATGTQIISIGSSANAANALTLEAGNTGKIQIGNGTTAHTIQIGAGGTSAQAITIGSTSSTSALIFQSGTGTVGGDINIGDEAVTGKVIDIGSVDNSATSTVHIATASGTAQTVAIGSSNSVSTTSIQGGAYSVVVRNDGVGIGYAPSTAVNFDLGFGESGSTRTIGVQTRTSNVAGTGLTISGGTAGSGASAFTGGTLTLTGGAAGGTGAANGANVVIQGGAGTASGFQGLVNLSASVFTTAVIAAYTSGPQTVAATAVDNNSAIQISSTVSSPITVTIPAPDNPSTGRVLYVTVAGSNQINLTPTGGTTFLMNAGSTATLIWNVALSAWTNAGVDGGSNSYIQNQVASTQSANFKIQGKTGNVAATIQGESGNSADILDLVSSAGGTPVVAVDHSGNLTFNQASTVKSNAGILTFQGFAGTNINTPTASAAATSDVNIATGNETGSFASGNIFMQTGSGSGTNSGSGSISLDVGAKTGSGTAGSITIGTGANSPSVITIGKVGVTTTNQGNITIGASAGSGTTFTNNGATVNTVLAVTDRNGSSTWLSGTTGDPTTTVDKYTSFTVNQSTTSITVQIPNPTSSTAGRVIYIANIGSASFTLLSATLNAGSTATLLWNGTAWTFAGADGSSILNQNTADQSANFRISGTGRANTSFTAPLFDAITASTLNIGTGVANAIQFGNNANNSALTLDSGTGTIAIGTGGQARAINIGTSSSAAQTIQVGSTNASSVTKIVSGSTNGVQIQSASINAFRIQDGASFTLLTADTITNKRIDIGTDASTLSTTGNGDLFVKGNVESPGTIFFGVTSNGVTVDSTNHQVRFSGSARNSITNTLVPEYVGAVMTATGSGTNVGTMTSDFCSNSSPAILTAVCGVANDVHNFYTWTTSQATAQDYDIFTRWQVPSNYDTAGNNSPAVTFYGWRTSTTNDALTLTVKNGATTCGTITVSGSNAAWTQGSLSSASCGTITAGSTLLTFDIHMSAATGDFVRAGEIGITYNTVF